VTELDHAELAVAFSHAITKAPADVVNNALREFSLLFIGLRKAGDPTGPHLDAASREAAARIQAALDRALGPVE